MAACQWGARQNPAVLILYGWLDHAYGWEPIGRALAEHGYCVYALDQRGHGLSEHVPHHSQYHFVDYVADVDAWLSANHVTTVHLIGHSMGGTVASLVAATCPERVRSLLLIEGLGAPHDHTEAATKRFIQHVHQRRRIPVTWIFQPKKMPLPVLWRLINVYRSYKPGKLVDRILVYCDKGWHWSWDPRHKWAAAAAIPEDRFCALLSEIRAPTAFVLADASPYSKLFH